MTGASRGTGLLMAERMARMGAHVVLWSNELAQVASAADRLAAPWARRSCKGAPTSKAP